ncbi:MAG: hypothetical protein HXX09_09110 [Bacteroidetes bacterium]|nr:hypothetical protein [Bacteroidota bacterium]
MTKQKIHILITFLFLKSSALAFGQDSIVFTKNQDTHLRAVVILVDSISKPCNCSDSKTDSLYKFEISHLYSGQYQYKYVYVCANISSILKFNPDKKTNISYYWVLIKTNNFFDGIPIYRHGGNF